MNPQSVPLKDLTVYGFWSHNPSKYPKDRQWFSCFSNWYSSNFTLNVEPGHEEMDTDTGETLKFINVEQFMMYCKATRFGDIEIAHKIMNETNPKELKALGRKVKGYDDKIWSKFRYAIVLRGLNAKFGQNEDLMKYLLQTGTKLLAEASPYDNIWGIGLAPNDPKTQDPMKWNGLNLLGKGLVEVRNTKNSETSV